jgi:hypothetical protein
MFAFHLVRGPANRLDDVDVARAAAKIAIEGVLDLVFCRIGIPLEQVYGGHDHSRRAVAALQAVLFVEAFLHRVERSSGRDPLDRRDLRSIGLGRQDRARLNGPAVQMNRAGAALASIAAHVRAGELEIFSEEVDEQGARLDRGFVLYAVNCDANGNRVKFLNSHRF